jgi:hypothetical protein
LLTKIAASDTQTVDGTVKVTTDLGLPSALSGGSAAGLFGGAGASDSAPAAGARAARPRRRRPSSPNCSPAPTRCTWPPTARTGRSSR